MANQETALLTALEAEIERVVIPGAGTDLARNMATLAARQLRREIVDHTVMPDLRRAAVDAYAALLPSLREILDQTLYDRLSQILVGAEEVDWIKLDIVLTEAIPVVLVSNPSLAGTLLAIDARLRAAKEQAWIDLGKTKPPHADALPPGGLSDDEKDRLGHFLRERFPDEAALRIGDVTPVPGGYSKQTMFVTLENSIGLPEMVVVRRDAAYETTGGSVVTEFPVLDKMFAHGVAVPQPFALEETGRVLGRPFIVVSRVKGRTIGDFVVVAEPSRALALDLARKLAALHAVPVDGLENILRGGICSTQERILGELDKYEQVWQGITHHHSYVVQGGIDWLRRNIDLAYGARVIVHADIGVHNFLVQDDQVAAFLDWETCVVGNPLEDLGYVHYPVAQMMDWDEFLATYEAAAGVVIDRRRLDYFILYGSMRVAPLLIKLAQPALRGDRPSLPEYYAGDYFGQKLIQRIGQKLSEILAR